MEILISFISLGIALFALGWNVYKDVIQKPRFKVSFGVYNTSPVPITSSVPIIIFSGVNFGPGDVVIKTIVLKYKRKEKPFGIIVPKTEWNKVPQRVSVGDEVNILTEYDDQCFLSTDFIKAGLIDLYGRYHWVSKRDIAKARKQYHIDFGM